MSRVLQTDNADSCKHIRSYIPQQAHDHGSLTCLDLAWRMERSLAHHKACCSGNAAGLRQSGVPRLHSHRRRCVSQGAVSQVSSAGSQSRHVLVASLLDTRATKRRSVSCNAKDNKTAISGYTPSDYITFSDDPAARCTHRTQVLVEAPVDACFGIWNEWSRLVEFLDLIGQIGLDKESTDMALFQCFYRFQQLPVMEICFLLQKVEVVDSKSIKFETVWGMPLMGEVTFTTAEDGRTRVSMYFSHPMPVLLMQLSIGTWAVENDVAQVLEENMAEFKQIVEAAAPSDWPVLKEQAAKAAAEEAVRAAAEARAAAAEAAKQAAEAASPEQAQQGTETPSQQQGDDHAPSAAAAAAAAAAAGGSGSANTAAHAGAEAPAAASSSGDPSTSDAAGSGRRRRTSRKTANAEPTDAAGPTGAPAAAAPKRGRRTSTRARSEEAGSSDSTASTSRKPTSRRGTATSAPADGAPAPAPPAARKTRARTSRSTASSSPQPAEASSVPQQPPVVNGVRSEAAQAVGVGVGAGRRATGSASPQ